MQQPDAPTASNLGPPAQDARRRRPAKKKTITLPTVDKRNWQIHMLFVQQDYEACEREIEVALKESNGNAHYAVYTKALIKRRQGELHESLALLERASKLLPGCAATRAQLGKAYMLVGDYGQARLALADASTMDPKNWRILHDKGMVYMNLKDYERAKQAFVNALSIFKSEGTYIELARVHLLTGDKDGAKAVYEQGLSQHPESIPLLTAIGLAQLSADPPNTPKAFASLGAALTYDQRDTKALLGATSIIQSCDDYDVALTKYRILAVRTPESPEVWCNIGMCFFGKKKFIAAVSCLKRAHYLAPFHFEVCYNLGLVHLHMDQHASAFHYLSAAVNIRPDDYKSYHLLGVALGNLADIDNARQAWDKAVALAGKTPIPSLYLNYAILLYNHGERQEAALKLALFEKAMAAVQGDDKGEESELSKIGKQLGTAIHLGIVKPSYTEEATV